MGLDPMAVVAGVRHVAHHIVGSTNAEALTLARAGERGPLWITAGTQNAGRGRRGSHWDSPAGNLHATLLLSEPAPPQFAPQLSFVAALAVHDAVAQQVPRTALELKLKWPNDVLLSDRKLAGILVEGESEPVFAVAVGIGVNCAHHPESSTYPATDLAAVGAAVSAGALFTALSVSMSGRLAQWRRGDGFASIRTDWLSRAAGLGGEIRVRLPERELCGVFDGLDETGKLMLRHPGGAIEPIAAGEVFSPPASGH